MSDTRNPETLAFSVRDFCAAVGGLSKSSLYKLIRNGEGPTVTRLGHRLVITKANAEAWLRARETATV